MDSDLINATISEFMDQKQVKYDGGPGEHYEWLPVIHQDWLFKSPPPFDRTWGWMMPVITKIRAIDFTVTFKDQHEATYYKLKWNKILRDIDQNLLDPNISKLADAVYALITLYKEQKQN